MQECIVKYNTRHQEIVFRCWVRELSTVPGNMIALSREGLSFSNVTIKSIWGLWYNGLTESPWVMRYRILRMQASWTKRLISRTSTSRLARRVHTELRFTKQSCLLNLVGRMAGTRTLNFILVRLMNELRRKVERGEISLRSAAYRLHREGKCTFIPCDREVLRLLHIYL